MLRNEERNPSQAQVCVRVCVCVCVRACVRACVCVRVSLYRGRIGEWMIRVPLVFLWCSFSTHLYQYVHAFAPLHTRTHTRAKEGKGGGVCVPRALGPSVPRAFWLGDGCGAAGYPRAGGHRVSRRGRRRGRARTHTHTHTHTWQVQSDGAAAQGSPERPAYCCWRRRRTGRCLLSQTSRVRSFWCPTPKNPHSCAQREGDGEKGCEGEGVRETQPGHRVSRR